jgi:ATP-dependent Clp protease adaptor protein ClpS
MAMANPTDIKPKTRTRTKVARPPLHKVILVNDDYTPREFVVRVLKAEFRITEDQANRIMITAHTKGVCVVAVFTREVAEAKATRATEMAAMSATRCSSPPNRKSSPQNLSGNQ